MSAGAASEALASAGETGGQSMVGGELEVALPSVVVCP